MTLLFASNDTAVNRITNLGSRAPTKRQGLCSAPAGSQPPNRTRRGTR